MNKKIDSKNLSWLFFLVAVGFSLIVIQRVWSQAPEADSKKMPKKEVTYIETEIGFDQVIEEKDAGKPFGIKEDDVFFEKEKEADVKPEKKSNRVPSGFRLKEDQVVLVNQTLKKILEENDNLRRQNEDLDGKLKYLRGQRQIEINRMNKMTDDIKSIRDRTMQIVEENQSYATEVVKMKAEMERDENEYKIKMKELKDQLGLNAQMNEPMPSKEESLESFKKSLTEKKKEAFDVVSLVEQLNKENDQLKQDAVRIHYNMGNAFYHKGRYHSAVEEYQKALEIDPSDANSHFNIAFISGQYLRDFKVSLQHYQEYLFLRPDAEDANMVKEKIIEATLEVRSGINSPLEDGITKEHRRSF